MNTLEYENYHETKEHYENEFTYNTYPCTIPLDFPQVPLHWHNEMEFIYVKKGCASILIDMQEFLVHAGSIAIILPGQIHGITQYEDSTVEYENIIFNVNMLIPSHGDDMTRAFFKKLMDVHYHFPCIIAPITPENREMISCIDRADKICQDFPSGYFLGIRSSLYEFFFHLSNMVVADSGKNSHTSTEHLERIKTITNYIEGHYEEDITIEKMADICNISHSHFMKFFKTYMGTSFINYLNDYRLLIASRMLTTSDEPITEIATKCGFDNISYFNRLFKRKYNVTPKQMR